MGRLESQVLVVFVQQVLDGSQFHAWLCDKYQFIRFVADEFVQSGKIYNVVSFYASPEE